MQGLTAWKQRAAALCALAPLVFLAASKGVGTGASYTSTTEHYQVGSDISNGFTELVGRHMEAMYREYTRRFSGFARKVPGKFTVKVFARQADYNEAVPENLRGTTGAFVSRERALLAYKEGRTDEEVLRSLYHEGFHQFAFTCISQDLPLWVNEGLAEYFSEAVWNGQGFTTGQVPAGRLRLLREALNGKSHIPLKDLLAMESEQWLGNVRLDQSRASMQYCEVWSIVHYLVLSEGGRNLQKLLEYLRKISSGVSRDEAFKQSFGPDVKAFERAWADYVMKLKLGPDDVCRKNLETLSFMALSYYRDPARFVSLNAFRNAVLSRRVKWEVTTSDGEKIDSSDKARAAALFRCPYDQGQGALSYTLSRDPQSGLPVLLCTHHRGVVLKAYYVPKHDGALGVRVEQVARGTLQRSVSNSGEAPNSNRTRPDETGKH
jgi:hypothetical protein